MAKLEVSLSSLISDLEYYTKLVMRFKREDGKYTDDEVDAIASLFNSKNLDAFHDELIAVLEKYPGLRRTYNANAHIEKEG